MRGQEGWRRSGPQPTNSRILLLRVLLRRYEGDWFNDKMNGKGVYVSPVLWDHQYRYAAPQSLRPRRHRLHCPAQATPFPMHHQSHVKYPTLLNKILCFKACRRCSFLLFLHRTSLSTILASRILLALARASIYTRIAGFVIDEAVMY